MTEEETLKPCPFCGGQATIQAFHHYPTQYWAQCADNPPCSVEVGGFLSEAEAIAAWNRRADGWISVAERLPEVSHENPRYRCLVSAAGYVSEKVYVMNVYAKTTRGQAPRWEEPNGKLAYNEPEFWQPLPPPPARQRDTAGD